MHSNLIPSQRNRTIHVLILAGILAAGGFLRLWRLGAASLWVDEINTHYSARSWNESGRDLFPSGKQDGRAQALTLTTALVYRLFGTGEAATRLPAAAFGIANILIAYALGRRLFGPRAGLLTAFFMAFSHFEVGWSRTARMYTLLQAVTLCLAALYLCGFERKAAAGTPGRGLRNLLGRAGVSPVRLLGFAVLLGAAFLWVHPLVVLVLPGVLLFWTGAAIAGGASGPGRWLNKYSIAAAASILLSAAAMLLLPGLRSTAWYFITYTPTWAAGESAARIRTLLIDTLVSGQSFPLAAFFFIGTLMLISRPSAGGWLVWCLFAAPLGLLTFVFSHREPTYLFFVYPFFLMIAAFGFTRLVEGELERMGTGRLPLRGLLVAAALSVFVVSPWLRITAHIPFLPDGVTNTVVTPEEWRQASADALAQRRDGDLVITSLPQAALVYGLRSDWCLNRAVAEQSVQENFPRDDRGRVRDVYAGVPCVPSLDSLRALVDGHPRGWILVTAFHFENSAHISPDVRAFLTERLGPPAATANGTVLTFRWPGAGEARP
jgi:4-amino-4-deoxy-L-arabinose transferase-like glycosyltransferase